ncbi:MAG: cytochrome c peroxidase [bacterium]
MRDHIRRWQSVIGACLGGCCIATSMPVVHAVPAPETVADVRRVIQGDADSLGASLAVLARELSVLSSRTMADAGDERRIRSAFRKARTQYKRAEGIVEFYAPALAAEFNSRRQEVDDEDAPPPSTFGARGFPAIEELLWPSVAAGHADSAQHLVEAMGPAVAHVREIAAAISPTDAQVIEFTRLELVRVSTLGIAGFDAPRTGDAMRESADALDGVRSLYAAVGDRWPTRAFERARLDSGLMRAIDYLRAHPDFESFDRLAYLAEYGEPVARALDSLRRAIVATSISMPRGLRADVASPYAANAFDARAYAPRTTPPSSRELVALGRRLFFDPSLSGTGRRSCATCHDPNRAFSDGVPKATSVDTHGAVVARNTPTLINAGLQPAQFADGRAATLEDQVIEVLRSRAEMGSSVERVVQSLRADASYSRQFARAFVDSGSAEMATPIRVRQALATYVRSLSALNSRFDKAVRGDTEQLSAEERRGFNLFMGKAGCGTCHFAPLFSGSTPPRYVASDVEVIGTPLSPRRPATLDADRGRAQIDGRPEHERAFKTPSLRNVALTAPYMHNGSFASLDDVIRFYDAGGGRGAGARITNQTLASDSLHLSAAERSAIRAFLGSLTDTAVIPQER